MAASRILAFAFLGTLVTGWAWAQDKLPAADIVRAINDSEAEAAEADDTQEPPPVTGTPIEWDFYAIPEGMRSWLFFSMPPEAFDRLEENQDEHGKPVFADDRT